MTINLKQASSLLLLATSLGVSAPGLAIPIHITATGTISDVSGLYEYANVGDTWTLEATYESDTPNTHPYPNRGSYIGLQDVRVTVGTTQFSLEASNSGVSIGNDLAGAPSGGTYTEYFYLIGQFAASPLGFNLGGLYGFNDLADGVLPSAALPTDPVIVETFFQQYPFTNSGFVIADMRDEPEPLWINGSISSVTASVASVPEPSALALLLPALLGMGLARRKQRLTANAA